MAGYAVVARIGREQVRPGPAWHAPDGARPIRVPPPAAVDERIEEVAGRSLGEVVAERWIAIREGWAQTTFFLFDPESWR